MDSRYVGAVFPLILTAGALSATAFHLPSTSLAEGLPTDGIPAADASVIPIADVETADTCTAVMDSRVCTWVKMDGQQAVELGASIPIGLIENVPLDAEMVWPPEQLATVALPAKARTALGIDHMVINWEAHGHPPMSFMAAHFDFHFYSLSPEEVDAIDCSDTSKPADLPAQHVLPDVDVPGLGMLTGLCVPRMGMHAMPKDDASSDDAFEASMMVGYYQGAPIFFEPMVSRDRLLERSDFELDVPEVQGLPKGVQYPREFRAEWDAESREYRLVFSGFGTPHTF